MNRSGGLAPRNDELERHRCKKKEDGLGSAHLLRRKQESEEFLEWRTIYELINKRRKNLWLFSRFERLVERKRRRDVSLWKTCIAKSIAGDDFEVLSQRCMGRKRWGGFWQVSANCFGRLAGNEWPCAPCTQLTYMWPFAGLLQTSISM